MDDDSTLNHVSQQGIIDSLRSALDNASNEIGVLRVLVDELAGALVDTPCECPTKCRCGRDAALQLWGDWCRN